MKRYRNRARPNKEEFEQLYYTLGLSVNEIAQKYKVSNKTVYNWAYYFRRKEEFKNG